MTEKKTSSEKEVGGARKIPKGEQSSSHSGSRFLLSRRGLSSTQQEEKNQQIWGEEEKK